MEESSDSERRVGKDGEAAAQSQVLDVVHPGSAAGVAPFGYQLAPQSPDLPGGWPGPPPLDLSPNACTERVMSLLDRRSLAISMGSRGS